MAVINGTSGDDVLRGTKAPDRINGLGGDDKLYDAGDGNVLRGGAGDDVIVVEGSGDYTDFLDNNRLYGGVGRDVIVSGNGSDDIYGGTGDDRLFGGYNRDTFHWQSGDGDDVIDGGPMDDPYELGTDLDVFDATLADAAGPTSFAVEGDRAVTVDITDDARLTLTEVEQFAVHGGAGADTIDFRGYAGRGAPPGYEWVNYTATVEGGDGNDRIFATAHDDYIQGGEGNDFISLRGGNDVCVVGGGDDLIYTGSGRDTISIDGDVIGSGRWTVADFNPAKDGISFYNLQGPEIYPDAFDTNGNGYLDRDDDGARVKNGALTLDLGRFVSDDTGSSTLTLLGVTKLDMDVFGPYGPGI